MKYSFKKDFIWNALGSSLNSFNSLFFLIIVTRINGLGAAGYFSYGFTISNILLVLATFGGRTYQVTDTKDEFSTNMYKSFRYITTILTLLFSIIFFLIFDYTFYKYIIIILLIVIKCLESIIDEYYAVLQKNDKLFIASKSLFYRSLVSAVVFISSELFSKKLLLSVILWLITNLLFLIFVDIKNVKKVNKDKFKLEKSYKLIFQKMFFFFLFNFLSIFIINIPRYFIDFHLTDELQGIYGILIMPATIILLLSQFILTPYALKMSLSYQNDKNEFNRIIKKIVFVTITISLACIFFAYIFGIPVLNIIYNLNLNDYKLQLIIVMFGALVYAVNTLLSIVFTIKRKIKYMVFIYIATIIISSLISYFLIINYSLLGGVISYTITMMIILLLYLLGSRQ